MIQSLARVHLELDDDLLQQAYEELTIKRPPAWILNHSGKHANIEEFGKVRGYASQSDNEIGITTQGESFTREGLYVLTKHLRFTVLHELRHIHQFQNWPAERLITERQGPYELRGVEIDANAWAEYAMPGYVGIVRVTRQAVGKSGFARMSERVSSR